MHLSPDPDFEEFALDCIRLSNQEKSPILRRNLLTLAREWMHAAMHQQSAEIHRESTERRTQIQANPGPMSMSATQERTRHSRTIAGNASFLCRDVYEVRAKGT